MARMDLTGKVVLNRLPVQLFLYSLNWRKNLNYQVEAQPRKKPNCLRESLNQQKKLKWFYSFEKHYLGYVNYL